MTRHAQRLTSLAELGGAWTQQALAVAREQAHLAALVAAARALDLERQAQSAHGLFVRSVGPVTPLPASGNALIVRPAAPPHPRQRELDEQAAVRESMSDEVNLESLLLTDDGLSYRRPGIAPDVVTRLRKGQWTLQGQIDLHGHNRDEARRRWPNSSASASAAACAACAWSTARATARPGASRCSRPGCSVGWRSARR